MLFFRSEELIDQWCSSRATPRRPSVRMDQLWQMAVTWYATRLKAESRRPAAAEMRSIFEGIGLYGDFWDPQADAFG
ncbi:MAG TPA: hypothetical protein VLB12_12450 [Gemmatimonadales bacterium]|nr:hypothetical protein [Gemmatimonadales bacterium]